MDKQPPPPQAEFVQRFFDRKAAQRYHDRYRTGRHARINAMEHAALRQLLAGLGHMDVAIDLPSGTGRLADVLAEVADRVILADSSPLMLEIARQELGNDNCQYLQTHAENTGLPTAGADLVFCHRLLNHIPDPGTRARIVGELARISRRYVVISCYPPGLRTRLKLALRRLAGSPRAAEQPASIREYVDLAAQAGLQIARRHVLRRLPFTAELVLFERAGSTLRG